jgi:hypothetical protein
VGVKWGQHPTAREIGADESSDAFEDAMSKLAPPPKAKGRHPRSDGPPARSCCQPAGQGPRAILCGSVERRLLGALLLSKPLAAASATLWGVTPVRGFRVGSTGTFGEFILRPRQQLTKSDWVRQLPYRGNTCRTKQVLPCAEHVTWTRRYWMILDSKALILLALLRLTTRLANSAIWRMKKPANALALRAFYLVAGVGFEPTTFRL